MNLFVFTINIILFVVSLYLLLYCRSLLVKVKSYFEKHEVEHQSITNKLSTVNNQNTLTKETEKLLKVEVQKEIKQEVKQETKKLKSEQIVEEMIKELENEEGINCIEINLPKRSDITSRQRQYIDKQITFDEFMRGNDNILYCFSLESKEYILERYIQSKENLSRIPSHLDIRIDRRFTEEFYSISKKILIKRFDELVNMKDLPILKEVCKKEIRLKATKNIVNNMGI
ncbi:hypothetical protein D3C87_80580 [compost metagenome]